MKRTFTKYPSSYVKASKSWGKVSTNPKVATVIADIARNLRQNPEVESLEVMSNGDLQFVVDQTIYYLKVSKR